MVWPIWTLDEARAADQQAQEQGVPFASLLALAGFQLARYVRQQNPAGRIVILTGPGSNGADGWVAARHLARDYPVTVVPVVQPRFPGAKAWIRAARGAGVAVARGREGERRLGEATLVVDAIFGTGFHGSVLESPGSSWLSQVASTGAPVIAVDMPSGVDTNTGACDGPVMNIRSTVTMGAAKWGLVGYPAAGLMGDLVIADIGLEPRSFGPTSGAWINPGWASHRLPRVTRLGHKYDRGHVVVIGGSRAMPGAPVLAAMAALKAGAGLVELVMPQGAGVSGPAFSPALIRHLVPDTDDGHLRWSEELKRHALRADVLVLGPGLGRAADPRILLELGKLGIPAVVDADGIRLVADVFGPLPTNWVLTPHAGEMGALIHEDREAVNADRRDAVLRCVARYGCAVLLKGRFSLIAEPDHIWVNPTGDESLATAGSGDVLSGIVARLMASGLSNAESLALAAYWHGWAGELGGREQGMSLTAEDLLEYLAPAARAIEEQRQPSSLIRWE